MTSWSELEQELGLWSAADRRASLWWRDDDAREVTPALETLLALAGRHRLPLALAVIPEGTTPGLARRLRDAGRGITVLQHGIAHENNAPAGHKKQELTVSGDAEALRRRLSDGRRHLSALFGSLFVPVMVPPWNRIDREIEAALPGLGYVGLSAFGSLDEVAGEDGLARIDCHLDIFGWKPTRRFRGDACLLADLRAQLALRRGERRLADAPLGIMTHHLVHDTQCWAFLERLYSLLTNHPGVRFLSGAHAFADLSLKTKLSAGAQGENS